MPHMPTAAAPRLTPSPARYAVRGVEAFAAGQHRGGGRAYTEADLDDMVRNFALNRDIYRSPVIFKQLTGAGPVGIGHSEKQPLTDETGVPKIGTVDRLARRGKFLTLDLTDLLPQVAGYINAKNYDRVSVEVYPQPPRGFAGKGCTLRRVALLGGEPPEVKALADLPPVTAETYSESRTWRPATLRHLETIHHPDRGTYEIFSEVRMDNDKPEGTPPAAAPADHKQQLAEKYGVHPDHVAQMSDQMAEHLCSKFAEMETKPKEDVVGQSTEGLVKGGAKPPEKKEDERKPEMYAEERLADLIGKALDARLGTVTATAHAAVATLADAADRLKREDAEKHCEQLRKDGKITAAQMDASGGRPTILATLLAQDNTQPVYKFSEGGKEVALTAYQAMKQQLSALPAVGRGPKIGAGGPDAPTLDAEAAKVEQHWESHSEQFRRLNTPKAEFVEAFTLRRKREPDLSAERFLAVK